jgi:hypothetical protein
MMNASKLSWFRTGYVAAAVCLTVGASCVLPAPGLARAIMTVGTDVQLPLERVATDNLEPAQATDVPAPLHAPVPESIHAQSPVLSWKETGRRADANARAPRYTPGYQRAITDFKYWT